MQKVALGHDTELIGRPVSILVDATDHGEGVVLVVVDRPEMVVVEREPLR